MAEKLTWPGHKKINYATIEDEPEGLEEEDNFFAEFYKDWYNEDPFQIDSLGAIQLCSTHNKSQELAEAANKKRTYKRQKK